LRIVRGALLICGLVASDFITGGMGVIAQSACPLQAGPEHTVARVIDGETVELSDRTQVRLAGIVAPRARDVGNLDARWPPERAAHDALSALLTGHAVRLRFDDTRRDRHGITHAYLTHTNASDGRSVQEQLLAGGFVRAEAIEGARACVTALLAAEAVARAAGLGLWQESAYRVRSAAPARDLAAYRGTFQIITGTIGSVETGRGVTRLVVGPDRRRDLTLTIRHTDRGTIGGLGGDLKSLAGRKIEARGWLIQRASGGPDIDVSLAGHIKLLATAE
jgi:micrococcal nuclease